MSREFQRIINTILALLLVVTISSCGDDTSYRGAENVQSSPLVKEVNKIQLLIAQGILLSNSTVRDRQTLDNIFNDVEAGALKLNLDPNHKGALNLLVNSLRNLRQFGFLQEDESEMNDFFKLVSRQIEKFAKIQGRRVDDIGYTMFSYRFSNGLSPFGNFKTDGNGWTTREALDRWFTSVNIYRPRGRTQAWLLSPTFNLENVRNPKFRVRHSYNLRNEDPDHGFSSTRIINNAFKALVSTDYKVGDPTKTATWKRVPLYSRLAGMDFDTGSSNLVDLSEFEGQNITIALAVDYDPNLYGSHAIGWTIEQFDFVGLGDLGEIIPRAGELYEHSFTNKNYSPYQVVSFVEDGVEWIPDGRNNRTEWMLAKAFRDSVADSWLISPEISLFNANNMMMEIEHTTRNQIWENMELFISTSYDGSDPRTFANWEKLDPSKPDLAMGSWNNITTKIDLKKYENKKIVLAFRFKQDAGVTRPDLWDLIGDDRNGSLWEIKSLKIIGLGSELNAKKVDLDFN